MEADALVHLEKREFEIVAGVCESDGRAVNIVQDVAHAVDVRVQLLDIAPHPLSLFPRQKRQPPLKQLPPALHLPKLGITLVEAGFF